MRLIEEIGLFVAIGIAALLATFHVIVPAVQAVAESLAASLR